MADELIFYTNPMSRGRIVRWMLEEVGQPYTTEILQYAGSMKAPEYLAINPMGKVPAIKHGSTVVTESGAICAYLADAFPEAGLAPPPGDKARGPYFRWMFFAAGPGEQAMTNKAMGFEVPAGRERMAGYGTHADVEKALDWAVQQNEYIAGDRFTAADVYFGSLVGYGARFGSFAMTPAIETYFNRITSRPAAKRANEIDDKLAAEMQPPQPQPAA